MTEKEIVEFLLKDLEWNEYDNFLDRKMRLLNDLEHVVTDDLAIIRIMA